MDPLLPLPVGEIPVTVAGVLPAGVTIEAAVGDFLATRGSLQTRRAYGAAVREFFRQARIGLLVELRPEARPVPVVARLVRQYLDSVTRRAEAEPWRVVNPATVNARAAALRRFFFAGCGRPMAIRPIRSSSPTRL